MTTTVTHRARSRRNGKLFTELAIAAAFLGGSLPWSQDSRSPSTARAAEPEAMDWSLVSIIGPFMYIRSALAYDNVTMVEGAAVGSVAIAIRNPVARTTDWVFIEGDYMFLQVPGERRERVTHQPGYAVTSRNLGWTNAKPMARHTINTALLAIHTLDKRTALHTPFLAGQGSGADAVLGVELRHAQAYLSLFGLNWALDPAGGSTGKVIDQSPAAGSIIAPGSTVTLTLDGGSPTPPNDNGDTPGLAREFDLVDSQFQTELQAEITLDHDNTADSPNCNFDLKDVFFKLRPAPADRLITVRQHPESYLDLVLSAWMDIDASPNVVNLEPLGCKGETDCCDRGRGAEITFMAPQNSTCYIMAEVAVIDQGVVHLVVDWTTVTSATPMGKSDAEKSPTERGD